MKSLKTLKAKKLEIKKETLRTLTDSDLKRINGGYVNNDFGSSWCSTGAAWKCVYGCIR